MLVRCAFIRIIYGLGEFLAHTSNVNCLALSPTNGRTLATGGDDRRINLWIVGQPNCLMVRSLCPVQPARKTISCVSLARILTRQVYISVPLSPSLQSISGITSPVQSVIFNNTENWIGAGSKSGVIKVFDLDENKSKVLHHVLPTSWRPNPPSSSPRSCTFHQWSQGSCQQSGLPSLWRHPCLRLYGH